jgi:hypothetical protein
MKTLLLFAAIFPCFASVAQTAAGKDSTIVLRTDEYNNFKTPGNGNIPSLTVALDSIESKKLALEHKTTLISFNYFDITAMADSLYHKCEYGRAANLYTTAFRKSNDQGQVKHRYNAACCFARLNLTDSAFAHLYRIAAKGNYYNYIQLESEKCFEPLYADKRWQPLVKIVKSNADKKADKLNGEIKGRD